MKNTIIEILKNISNEDDVEITETTDLIENKIIDSLNLLMFLFEVEEKLGISIDASCLCEEDIKNVDCIMEFIKRNTNDR